MKASSPSMWWRIALAVGASGIAWAMAVEPRVLAQTGGGEHWVGTWATAVVARPQGLQPPPAGFGPPPQPAPAGQAAAPQSATPNAPPSAAAPPAGGRGRGGPAINFNNQTLRQIVHTSLGGQRVRVVLSNAFGTAPLAVGSAQIALRDKESAIVQGSNRVLTFGGSPETTIAAGAVALSDPVSLTVPALSDLALDLYLPGDTASSTSPLTMHTGAQQTNYVSSDGNHAGETQLAVATTTASWFFLSRIEVMAPEQIGAVVAFGDSITDGTRSTPDANNRWPDSLARRLAAQNVKLAVLNEGIAGNRVLADGAGVSALARFDRDALVQTGVTHVIVLESINDIGIGRSNASPTVEELIAGQRQLIERAHARGLKIFGGTLLPFEGAAYFTTEGEAKRQAFNQWIRAGNAYDGVVDFDAAVRDPASPTKLVPQYNSGDNLHLNDAGYQVMANAVDLALFKSGTTRKK
jgi:lysophospholipase L1-like esterase